MDNPDLPQGHNAPNARGTGQSKIEKALFKGSLWKKKTLRSIERTAQLKQLESNKRERDTEKMANLLGRLSSQLEERNHEILQLRQAISRLEESHQDELERLQDAYDQFEKESDSLLAELGEQNARLLDECRYENGLALLKP